MTAAERAHLLALGVTAWRAGDHFTAHERWEDVWRESVDPERRWLQGLIQIAAALHHVARGRLGAAAGLLARGGEKLADAPARLAEIDVDAVRGGAARLAAAIARGEAVDASSVTL